MQIDWITVAAQAVNFLVLLWLLQRFLYRPVIDAMDRREAAIAERIEGAEARRREADAMAEDFRNRTHELDARRAELVEAANRAAEDERRTLVAQAREEVAEERSRWLEGVQSDRDEFLGALNRTAAVEICTIARTVLEDLAHADLAPQLVATFVDKLGALEAEERDELARAAAAAGGKVTVRASTDLPAGLRDDLRKALREILGHDVNITFRRHARLSLGIEVAAGSRTLAWSVESYLGQLERRLVEGFDELAPEDARA